MKKAALLYFLVCISPSILFSQETTWPIPGFTSIVGSFGEFRPQNSSGTISAHFHLIRRFYPKKTDFATITPEQVRRVERILNSRPRKCLRFKTPEQVFRLGVALTG